jgi:hypothetical protein
VRSYIRKEGKTDGYLADTRRFLQLGDSPFKHVINSTLLYDQGPKQTNHIIAKCFLHVLHLWVWNITVMLFNKTFEIYKL